MDPELLKRLGISLSGIQGGGMPAPVTDFSGPPSATPNFGPVPDAQPLPGSEDGGEGGYIPDPAHTPGNLDVPDMPPKKNFVSRMLEHVLHIPSNADGVFTDEDKDAMRRSALLHASAALAGNSQQGFLPALIGAYSGMNSDFTNQVNAGIKTAGMSQEVQNTQQLRQIDAQIAAKYPALKNETTEQTLMRITSMASEYASRGQPDRAKALADVAKNIRAAIAKGSPPGSISAVHMPASGDWTIIDRSRGTRPYLKLGANPDVPDSWTSTLHDAGVETQNAFKSRRLTDEETRMVQTMDRYTNSKYIQTLQDYDKDSVVKPAMDSHAALSKLKTALANADNPASAGIITAQLAAFAEGKPRIQLGILDYIRNNINASWAGELDRYIQKARSGTLPPSQVHDVVKLVNKLEGATLDDVRKARGRYVRSRGSAFHNGEQLLDHALPLPEETFSPIGSGTPSDQPGMIDPDQEQKKEEEGDGG